MPDHVVRINVAIAPRRKRILIGLSQEIIRFHDAVEQRRPSLTDLSPMLSKLGDRAAPFPVCLGRHDGAQNAEGQEPRAGKPAPPAPRNIDIPPLHLDEINVKARNLR